VNAGGNDAFVSAFSASDGTWDWTRFVGSPEYDEFLDVDAIDSQVYAVGGTEGDIDGQLNAGGSDILVSKFDSAGIRDWAYLLRNAAY